MGGWIVLFFVAALTLLVNTVQTITSGRQANIEVESVVDTLANIVNAQYRHYLYDNPTGAAAFITSGLSGKLEWLNDTDCGGSSCYSAVAHGSGVKVLYQARSPAIAARIALHFGDTACIGDQSGACWSGGSGDRDHVILVLVPTENLALMGELFATRAEPSIAGGLFTISSLPVQSGADGSNLRVERGSAVFITGGINVGLSANVPSFGDEYQDHTQPLWGDDPNINFGGSYSYSGDGVLIEIDKTGSAPDAVRYTRGKPDPHNAASSIAAIALQAEGDRAIFSAGDLGDPDNHVIDAAGNLYVNEVDAPGPGGLVIHVNELEAR